MTGNHNHARNADRSMLTAVPDGPDEGNVWGLPTLPEALTGRLDAQAAMLWWEDVTTVIRVQPL
jgi:hypothetical protein